MFNSVNISIRLLAEYAADRGLLALRWGLDVARGYQRAADGKEGLLRCLAFGGRSADRREARNYADSALADLRIMGEARAEPGPLGVGARLAMTPAEFVDLQVMAENLRSEANRREQQNTGARA